MTTYNHMAGECNYDDIIAGPEPAALVSNIQLAASKTPLVRGTVLVDEDGKCAPIKAALTGASVVYILAQSFDAVEDGEVASAYKTGNFVRGRLVTNGSYELSATDFDFLRKAGLITTGMIEDVAPAE